MTWYVRIARQEDGSLACTCNREPDAGLVQSGGGLERAERTCDTVPLLYSETFPCKKKAQKRLARLQKAPELMLLPGCRLQVSRKKVKYARLHVNGDGLVKISIPLSYSERELAGLLCDKRAWIAAALEKLQSRQQRIALQPNQILFMGEVFDFHLHLNLVDRVQVDRSAKVISAGYNLLVPVHLEGWYRSQARKLFHQKLAEKAAHHGFIYNRLYIRSQRTKWGTCSAKGNISFNYKLIKAPESVIDYMVCHELAHTRFLDHRSGFQQLLAEICPGWKEAEGWLDSYGGSL
jgi:predicted metal-dependent hydrolase